jgi:hypothetical protein
MMVVAMIGFGMMIVNINNRKHNFLYMLSIGASIGNIKATPLPIKAENWVRVTR